MSPMRGLRPDRVDSGRVRHPEVMLAFFVEIADDVPSKILRFSRVPSPRTRPLSLSWQAARAGTNPRFRDRFQTRRPRDRILEFRWIESAFRRNRHSGTVL